MKTSREIVEEKYKTYIDNCKEVWKNRFTWRNKYGDPKYTTGIVQFFKETKILDELEHVNTLKDSFTQISNLAKKYTTWVKSKTIEGFSYSEKEIKDMENFFIGAIGEFFIVCLLTKMKCIIKFNKVKDTISRYDFKMVSPTLQNEKDLGVDLTCIANGKPSVIQIKWWNPYSEDKPNIEVFQKLVSEGLVKGYCNPEENDNHFLFWTGDEKYTTKKLDDYGYQKYCVDFGDFSIGQVINNRAEEDFWNYFYDKLSKLD